MTDNSPENKKKKILLVDDDTDILEFLAVILEPANFQVESCQFSGEAMPCIEKFMPDLIILDIVMKEVDGFTLLQRIRSRPELNSVKVIFFTVKSFEFDRLRAFQLGADGYIKKPVSAEKLIEKVNQVLESKTTLTFWGTRGSLPSPGRDTLKYGGDTSCMELRLPRNRIMIFDAGTGIRKLGQKIAKEGENKKINLFITHPHWDHIFGLPFFTPTYIPGNEVVIYGASHGDISLREMVAGQMDNIYFPITIKEFGARVYFQELSESEYMIDGIKVQTHFLNHPGQTIGYRIWFDEKSIAYITDNELPLDPNGGSHDPFRRKKLVEFLDNVDVLIHDASYTDAEYKTRVGWGHPPLSGLLSLAMDCKAKELKLFHHEPAHTDEDIDNMVDFCVKKIAELGSQMKCSAAMEGEQVIF